ncbi:membrane copper amine oxidase [Saccharata proteae CBS 121410]|uniref:Amine oxidase n=1 Tax=Saccharata proteae CBS 121410 TaxID=1314787 RepID=A0A9P4HWV3_9PEZI|nr:membrane copper amine oxidase [Saccharata proteae CBS 121410]
MKSLRRGLSFSIVLITTPPKSSSAWMRKTHERGGTHDRWRRQATGGSCAIPTAQSIAAPRSNIWAGLTDSEAAAVTKWLFSQRTLNLTLTENAGEWDNTVLLVELMIPNKTDALQYFDGNATAPDRYAHVVVDHRASTEPYYQDLLVGPLPIRNGTTKMEPLTYPFTRKTEGRIRNLDADDETLYSAWIYKISASILDITLDLWNGSALGLGNDTLDIWGIDPLWQDDGIVRWDQFWSVPTDDFDAETLLPLGLYFMSNVTGRDPSKWSLEGWLYNNVYYPTTEAFRAAYYSPGFVKLQPNVEDAWAHTDQQGEVPPLDEMAPPMAVAPSGSRYFVDNGEKYVKWMDFELYIAFTRDTGMRLYDIRYKGQRIIYELGLQEALAHYAGNDPVQSGTSYLDSYYGFGPYSFELVPGYDCPAYATYLNSSFYTAETTHTHIASICLFEHDAGYPIQRHSTSDYVSVTKNIYFTIRNVCTVGNYDYMFDYQFYMDGSIHVSVRASGYIQSAYWAHNGDYGYQIQSALSGSMHDHVLNYKLDLDVLGTRNTMTTTSFRPVTTTYPWSRNHTRNTMTLSRSVVASEDESKLFWGDNGAKQYTVVNMDRPNAWGEYPGFRILPSQGTVRLTVKNSSNLVNAANWATHDLFVTRQHDKEPRSAHPYNNQDVAEPVVDFDRFFDGEGLVQEDVVVWFNLGMHHLPHTGDLPNTVFTTAHSGLQIMPLNYLPNDPSRATVNQVRLDYGSTISNITGSQVDTFGQIPPTCALDFATEAEEERKRLEGYRGDVVIRKFPFDPNDPWWETDSIV